MEIVGYCNIKRDAKTGVSPCPIEDFTTGRVRVMEFTKDGGVLVVNAAGTAVATFEACDVYRKFKCGIHADVITAPGLDSIQKFMYAAKVLTRKGGYNNLLREMIIEASLAKGEFYDHFLFAKQ